MTKTTECKMCEKQFERHIKDYRSKFCCVLCREKWHTNNKKQNGQCTKCKKLVNEINIKTGKNFTMCLDCREKRRSSRQDYANSRDICLNRAKKHYRENETSKKDYERQRRVKARDSFFKMYGKVCKHCGDNDLKMLTLEHVLDDGAEHRKKSYSTLKVYLDATKEFMPDRFCTLCIRCNWFKGQNGSLPLLENIYEDFERCG